MDRWYSKLVCLSKPLRVTENDKDTSFTRLDIDYNQNIFNFIITDPRPKRTARDKHSSLFGLGIIVSDKEKQFYNTDTRIQWGQVQDLFS